VYVGRNFSSGGTAREPQVYVGRNFSAGGTDAAPRPN
jgi:hypothetical protein